MQNVFIAGATGLLGSVLLLKLVEDCEISRISVLCHNKRPELNSEKIEIIEGSHNIRSIELTDYDVVYNCVGEKTNEDNMYAVNVEFAIDLLEQSIKCNVKTYVYFSSVGSYGADRYSGRISESIQSSPKNYYESTKKTAEDMLAIASQGIRLLILQPSNILTTSKVKSVLLPSLLKLFKGGIVVIISRKDGWLNYVSDEYVADIALELPRCKTKYSKFILNTPIKYKDALSILAADMNITPAQVIIPAWISNLIYNLCSNAYRFFGIRTFDVIARKIYEIDNDIYFQSESQVLLDQLGKIDANQLYKKIANRSLLSNFISSK